MDGSEKPPRKLQTSRTSVRQKQTKMGRPIFLTCLLSVILSVSCQTELRHIQMNGDHLIESGQFNYAIASSSFGAQNWRTVSVNGNTVTLIAANCQVASKDLLQMLPNDRRLIENTRNTLNQSNGMRNNAAQNWVYSRSSFSGNGQQSNYGSNARFSNFFTRNGMSISKSDENNYSVASQSILPVQRLFVDRDLVTFVYQDGRIEMKPMNCLSQQEVQLLQRVRLEMAQAERQVNESMMQMNQQMLMMNQQMQNNFANMQQQMQFGLQQGMQNMNNQLSSAFGNGFPFNNNNNQANNFMQQQYQRYPQQQQQQAFNWNGAQAHAQVY